MRSILLIMIFMIPKILFAEILFVSLLPNPIGDDSSGEYIEIYNTGCEEVILDGYEIRDLQRSYIFSSGRTIMSHTGRILTYQETKISLNNSGIETLSLYDDAGGLIHSYIYSGSQGEGIILYVEYSDDDCEDSFLIEDTEEIPHDTSHSDTGSEGSDELTSTGDTIIQTGGVSSENTNEEYALIDPILSGSLSSIEGTGGELSESGQSLSGSIQVLTGKTDTSPIFPKITPLIQSPTNALFQGEIFVCRTSDCKINISLQNIFTGSFHISDYICSFSTGAYYGIDDDCNPLTFLYTQPGTFGIRLTSKSHTGFSYDEIFEIVFDIPSIQRTSDIQIASNIPDSNSPIAIIEREGKDRAYYEEISDNELICVTSTCALNLTGERSYDKEGGNLQYFWRFSQTDTSDKKDPGERKFPTGVHTITLRVTDSAGNTDEAIYKLIVGEEVALTSSEFPQEPKITNSITNKYQKSLNNVSQSFVIPEIILQSNSSARRQYSDKMTCTTLDTTCGFNFQIANPDKDYRYIWSHETIGQIESSNPRTFVFPPGKHPLTLTITHKLSGESLYKEVYSLQVIKKTPIKKAKNTVSTGKKTVKKAGAETISFTGSQQEIASLIFPGDDTSPKLPYETIFLSTGSLLCILFRKKIFSSIE